MKTKGFTLIELLVVIAIIGMLSSIILASLNSARGKARDAVRKESFKQISNAFELYYTNNGIYPNTAGYFTNAGHGGLDSALTPTYIGKVPDDPLTPTFPPYAYLRGDYTSDGCGNIGTSKYVLLAKLERPTSADLATTYSAYTTCELNAGSGYNYAVEN